jgi:hypothetical protein
VQSDCWSSHMSPTGLQSTPGIAPGCNYSHSLSAGSVAAGFQPSPGIAPGWNMSALREWGMGCFNPHSGLLPSDEIITSTGPSTVRLSGST